MPGARDGEVWAGVRPEGFVPAADGPVECGLSRVEILGRDTSIVCTHPACQADTLRAIVRPEQLSGPMGSAVRFALKPEKVFLFDRAAGRRIRFGDGTTA